MQLLTLAPPDGAAHVTAHVFEDPKSQALLSRLRQIAPSEDSVLLIGEPGTGKEMVARHIHNLSPRRNGPFVAVDGGAFSEALIEAELFGHEKGAFTGALTSKAGCFEAAHGGTLFLDEVGNLPLAIQAKLLRALQEREVARLGTHGSIPIDVRVVTSASEPLEKAIKAGQFRKDLYSWLNIVELQLPPLRERTGDILPLVHHFIETYSARLGYGAIQITTDAEQKLLNYIWPGNIRELENVIHHTLLLCRNGLIRDEDLHLQLKHIGHKGDDTRHGESAEDLLLRAFHQLFHEHGGSLHEIVEDSLLRATYRFCHYNQVHTADMLGLSRNVTRARLIAIGELVVNKRRGESASQRRTLAQVSI